MQLRRLQRFFKASTVLTLAALAMATLAPVRAQEFVSFNSRVLNLPGGIGNTMTGGQANSLAGAGSFLFRNGGTVALGQSDRAGSNDTSDAIVGDFNGDGFNDIFIGSHTSDEVGLFLGRGNGSFVYADTNAGAGLTTSFAQDASAGNSAGSALGAVTSVTRVLNFSTLTGVSRVAVAIDYFTRGAAFVTPLPGGATGPTSDRIVYYNINPVGAISVSSSFSPNNVADGSALAFGSNPVSVTTGSFDQGGGSDLAYLCSGAWTSATGFSADGFAGIDRAGNSTIDQVIGGGVNAPVVPEGAISATSGSLYDLRARATGNTNNYTTPDPAVFPAGYAPYRRRFAVAPVTAFLSGVSPRAIAVASTAHRDDGAQDLLFVATDFGSVGTNTPLFPAPAPTKAIGEGRTYVLINNQAPGVGGGEILRNAREQSEDYDFSNSTSPLFGGQDGIILRAGNTPSGVAFGDFNGDNRQDIATSNSGSGTVTINNSGTIPITNNTPGGSAPTPQPIPSYPNINTTFIPVGGTPNTVYVGDLNRDGRPDVFGTGSTPNTAGNTLNNYAIYNSTTTPGIFTLGALSFIGSAGVAGGRAIAWGDGTLGSNFITGSSAFITAATVPGTVTGGIGIAVVGSFGVAARYFNAAAATSTTYTTITLSRFVGVATGFLNGDTIPDVAIADRGADRVVLVTSTATGFPGTAAGTVTTFINLADLFPNLESGGLTSLDIADVNGDNLQDIVVSVDGGNDQAIVLFNSPAGFADIDGRVFAIRAFPIGGDPTALKLADVGGPVPVNTPGTAGRDGRPDIIAVNRRTNSVTTLINNGLGVFGQGKVAETGAFDPLSQVLGDFNDDGRIDTAVLNRGRRNVFGTPGQQDDSIVSILLGNGDGSFQATNFLIPVARNSVSISAAGPGIVQNGIQIDTPDANGDGLADLAVASELGGGPSSDIPSPVSNSNEAPSLTVLLGSTTQAGQFTRNTESQRLVDTFGGGRIMVVPGANDPRPAASGRGNRIGYGVLTLAADFNRNNRVDSHVGGVEFNNGTIGTFFFPNVLANSFASSITGLDNLNAAFAASRTFNVFPSGANDSAQVSARVPVDVDAVTGVTTAGAFVESATGRYVSGRTNDFAPGVNVNVGPDLLQITDIGRAYFSLNASSILNVAPRVFVTAGNVGGTAVANTPYAGFNGPGRKIVLDAGQTATLTLGSADDDGSAASARRFTVINNNRGIDNPNFVTLTDNNNGTATLQIRPGATDGGVGTGSSRIYGSSVQITDNDFRIPLTDRLDFTIIVRARAVPPTIAPIPDQTIAATTTATVPVIATSATGRSIRLSASFPGAESFTTFTDAGGGAGTFTFRPQPADAGRRTVTVTATDDLGLSASTTFNVTVTRNTAPTVQAIADVTLNEGETRDVAVTATDPDAGQTITLNISGNPGFVSLSDNGGGRGSIRIAPQVGNAGTFTVSVTARDNGIPQATSAAVTFRITVRPTVVVNFAAYNNRRLSIAGQGFGTNPTVIINGTNAPASAIAAGASDRSITLNGNRRALNLRRGANTVVIRNSAGISSAPFSFSTAGDE